MIWVIDTSVAVKWLLKTESHPNAWRVLEKTIENPAMFAVPELFAFEVFSVLQRVHPKGSEAFQVGVIPLLEGGIYRQPMTRQLSARAAFFVRQGLTGYDACYAALAEELQTKWLTFDVKAHRAIASFGVSLNLVYELPEGW